MAIHSSRSRDGWETQEMELLELKKGTEKGSEFVVRAKGPGTSQFD